MDSIVFTNKAQCQDCNRCVRHCPVKAIIKVDNWPFWTFKCESCMKCMSNCPKKAIETGHGYVAAFIYLFSFFLVALYEYFNIIFIPFENALLKFILESILMVSFMGLWYRIVHNLLKIKALERLTVYTSLTKYKWWGRRYKALKNL